MSVMIEVYYTLPADAARETLLTAEVSRYGARLDFREETRWGHTHYVTLTFEFEEWALAEQAAERLRSLGEHVEGPCSYGPD